MNTPAIRLFSTDLDGTLLGNPVACWRFSDTWNAVPADRRPLLVYNTGHTVAATLEVARARRLPEPDYVIGSVGTELRDACGANVEGFCERFTLWHRSRVDEIVASTTPAQRQPEECQHEFKSSWHWVRASRAEIDHLTERLQGTGINARVDYSSRYFLDVVPTAAGKGNALSWLCQRLGIRLENVLVAGDTGNDTSMFLLPGVKGIVVENALPELRAAVVRLPVYTATAETADGVIEGLRHFDLMPGNTKDVSSR